MRTGGIKFFSWLVLVSLDQNHILFQFAQKQTYNSLNKYRFHEGMNELMTIAYRKEYRYKYKIEKLLLLSEE